MALIRAAASASVAIAALIALGGCGSDTVVVTGRGGAGAATPAVQVDAAYAAAADRICTAANAQVDALHPPGDPMGASAETLPRWAEYFTRLAAIHDGALGQLEALPPPVLGAPGVVSATALAGRVQADFEAVAAAARSGDLERYDAAVEATDVDMSTTNDAFVAIGLHSCG